MEVPKGIKLTKHWQEQHPANYAKIRKWLGDAEAKIRAAEVLASEGMRGTGMEAGKIKQK